MKYCKCGKPAVCVAYLPISNIYARLRQTTEPVPVCSYHAEKARKEGYDVEKVVCRLKKYCWKSTVHDCFL